MKIAGNDAFKENRLADAIEKYSEGLVVDEENDSMKATLLSNRATAYLRVSRILAMPPSERSDNVFSNFYS